VFGDHVGKCFVERTWHLVRKETRVDRATDRCVVRNIGTDRSSQNRGDVVATERTARLVHEDASIDDDFALVDLVGGASQREIAGAGDEI
jgi:hypothetical protein